MPSPLKPVSLTIQTTGVVETTGKPVLNEGQTENAPQPRFAELLTRQNSIRSELRPRIQSRRVSVGRQIHLQEVDRALAQLKEAMYRPWPEVGEAIRMADRIVEDIEQIPDEAGHALAVASYDNARLDLEAAHAFYKEKVNVINDYRATRYKTDNEDKFLTTAYIYNNGKFPADPKERIPCIDGYDPPELVHHDAGAHFVLQNFKDVLSHMPDLD